MQVLASIMRDVYCGDVVYVGIDTDRYKYPIGKLCSSGSSFSEIIFKII